MKPRGTLLTFVVFSPRESRSKILYGILNELDRSWIRKWNTAITVRGIENVDQFWLEF